MDPSKWGSCLWKTIHVIAIGYPKNPTSQQRMAYREFYENFWRVLPCYACSINYQRHLQEIPLEPYLVNNSKLFEWTVELHNVVNKELGKKIMTLEDAREFYKKMLHDKINDVLVSQGVPPRHLYLWVLTGIIVVLLAFIVIQEIRRAKRY